MRAMILAAGLGTRLRPLTETVPKPLLPVAGVPLIVWNLLLLRQHGIRDVIINLHYLGHLIQQELGDGARWGMRLSYSPEPELLGTGGGLRAAEHFFEGEDFVVVNGDTLHEVNLTALAGEHRHTGALATMVLRDDPVAAAWGTVETTREGRVLTITGRGMSDGHALSVHATRMFAGIHILHPRMLTHCPEGQASSIIDAYVAELHAGALVMSYLETGYWSDIGTPERYAQAQRDVAAGTLSDDRLVGV